MIYLLFVFILSIYDIFLLKKTSIVIDTNFIYSLIYNSIFSLLLLSLCALLGNFGFVLVCIILLTILLLYITEIGLYSAYKMFFPLDFIKKNTTNVLKNYIDEIKVVILHNIPIIMIMILLFICVMCLAYYINNKYYKNKKNNKSLLVLTLLFSIFVIFAYPVGLNNENDITINADNYGLKIALMQSISNNDKKLTVSSIDKEIDYIKETNNIFKIDFNDVIENEIDEDYKSISSYINSKSPSKKNKYTGIFKGKNVVMICAEAFSYKIVDKDLTPTLYKLINEGFKFNDFYVPTWGGSTTSGEFAFLTGLIPLHAGEAMKMTIGKNMSFTLPRALKRLGYSTAAFHNGNYDYYDRNKTHKSNMGFDDFYATGNGLENFTYEYPTDIELVDSTIVKYIDKQPFCLYYMSMTGHAYYHDDNSYKVKRYINRVKQIFGDRYPAQVNNYICAQLYLEDALKKMLDIFKENNIYDDTVICMVSDHYPYGLNSSAFTNGHNYLVDLYGEHNDFSMERDKNVPIIWSSCLVEEYADYNKEINSPSSSIDLLPTLLNLFGVEYDSRFLPGRDVMSDEQAKVFYNNGTFITDKVRYLPKEKKYRWVEGIAEDKNYINEIKEKMKNEILLSDLILKKNYFEYLKNNDSVSDYYKDILSMSKEGKVELKSQDLEGYVEYFKECNKKYLSEKKSIKKSIKSNTLYITIDDGPGANIDYILDVLKEKNVKATFFVTGTNHADDIKRIKSEGHAIGIHCNNHVYEQIYKDELSYFEDLYNEQKFLYETIGEYIHILRFPGGSNNSKVNKKVMWRIISILKDIGFEYYDWNFSIADSINYDNPIVIYQNFVNNIDIEQKQGIVLMHDLHIQTPLMLPYMIDYAIQKGFEFDVITDYISTIHFFE